MGSFDSWYAVLADRYGEEFCKIAGYFEETKPFAGSYTGNFDLPRYRNVIQFSGAFHPFHEGHLSIILKAIKKLDDINVGRPVLVIHADHSEYRHGKGSYDEQAFLDAFKVLDETRCEWMLVQ